MPLPRNRIQLDYSRWQHSLIGVMQIDVAYNNKIKIGNKCFPQKLKKKNIYLNIRNYFNIFVQHQRQN